MPTLATAPPTSLSEHLRELWRYRELLVILVQRDLKVRYKNSVLGFGWSLANPLLQVLVITFVLKFFMRVRVENYSASIFCAFLPWSFFQLSLMDAANSLVFHQSLVRRVYFPREILPLACVLSNLIHLGLALGVFLVYLALLPAVGAALTGRFLWTIQPTVIFAPLVIAILVVLTAGLALAVAALNLFYEDVRYLLQVGLNILYYLVPVLYFPEVVERAAGAQRWLYTLYMLNPLSPILSMFRKCVLPPTLVGVGEGELFTRGVTGADLAYLGVAAVLSLVMAAAIYRVFNVQKWRFAERP